MWDIYKNKGILLPPKDEVNLSQMSMPWFVPASSKRALLAKIEEAGEGLFDQLPIAGLVPGKTVTLILLRGTRSGLMNSAGNSSFGLVQARTQRERHVQISSTS